MPAELEMGVIISHLNVFNAGTLPPPCWMTFVKLYSKNLIFLSHWIVLFRCWMQTVMFHKYLRIVILVLRNTARQTYSGGHRFATIRAGNSTILSRQCDHVCRPNKGWLLPCFYIYSVWLVHLDTKALTDFVFFVVPNALLRCRIVALLLSRR